MTDTTDDDLFGEPWLTVGGRALRSRLILGVEQYDDPVLVGRVLEAAGADVFITTFDLTNSRPSLLLTDLDAAVGLDAYTWLGTTSFADSADNAIRTARMIRQSLGVAVIKLDVRNTANVPDPEGTRVAAKELLADGFEVLPLVVPDVAVATSLQDMGCSAIRLMGSAVGSAAGLQRPDDLRACVGELTIPVVVEGGIGGPGHVVAAMALGADAVLVNSCVARASDPVLMASAMRHAVRACGLAVRAA